MDKNQTICYRDGLDSQISDTAKEIDKNISFIIVGALAFYITMLDKFVNVQNASLLFFVAISFFALLVAFLLFLYCKHKMINHASKILNFVDTELTPVAGNSEKEQELLKRWKDSNESLNLIRTFTYVFLGIGVVCEVIFFTFNVMNIHTKPLHEPQKVVIEFINKK